MFLKFFMKFQFQSFALQNRANSLGWESVYGWLGQWVQKQLSNSFFNHFSNCNRTKLFELESNFCCRESSWRNKIWTRTYYCFNYSYVLQQHFKWINQTNRFILQNVPEPLCAFVEQDLDLFSLALVRSQVQTNKKRRFHGINSCLLMISVWRGYKLLHLSTLNQHNPAGSKVNDHTMGMDKRSLTSPLALVFFVWDIKTRCFRCGWSGSWSVSDLWDGKRVIQCWASDLVKCIVIVDTLEEKIKVNKSVERGRSQLALVQLGETCWLWTVPRLEGAEISDQHHCLPAAFPQRGTACRVSRDQTSRLRFQLKTCPTFTPAQSAPEIPEINSRTNTSLILARSHRRMPSILLVLDIKWKKIPFEILTTSSSWKILNFHQLRE